VAARHRVHEDRRPDENEVTLDGSILAFTGIAVLLTILPGADMALVAKVTLLDGRRAAFFTSLGICAGLPVHATASALGLSLILATSAEAFTVVKFAGAAYLAYLGIRTIRDSLQPAAEAATPDGRVRRRGAAFAQGWLSNVLNPKVALFYLTFLPQFISPGDNVLAKSLLLAGIHAVLGLAWLPLYAYAIDRLGAVMRGARRLLERVTGAALIGLGLRLALERR
jgi:threonine/homoserine/homoserine lactone efflux protein